MKPKTQCLCKADEVIVKVLVVFISFSAINILCFPYMVYTIQACFFAGTKKFIEGVDALPVASLICVVPELFTPNVSWRVAVIGISFFHSLLLHQ